MSLEVKIPPMGESITSGVLAKWHVADGDLVKKDQVLFELETDKITSEGTAEAAGKISLKVAAGTEVKIGAVVAVIDTASPVAQPQDEPRRSPQGEGGQTAVVQKHDAQSPAVRRLAAETGIDPASVAGSGKAGRVTKGDMLAAAETKPATTPSSPVAKPTIPSAEVAKATSPSVASAKEGASDRQSRKKMTPLRARIAQRLVQAKQTTAMLTTFNEADMSGIMGLRTKYQDDFVKKNGVKLGFMSFFVKAVVNALKEVPAINAQIDGDSIIENHYFDIGVAVSTDKGLIVPVIRDCDRKSLADIEKDIADAAKRAREGKRQRAPKRRLRRAAECPAAAPLLRTSRAAARTSHRGRAPCALRRRCSSRRRSPRARPAGGPRAARRARRSACRRCRLLTPRPPSAGPSRAASRDTSRTPRGSAAC